jgi:hypothetical protein
MMVDRQSGICRAWRFSEGGDEPVVSAFNVPGSGAVALQLPLRFCPTAALTKPEANFLIVITTFVGSIP